MKRTFALVTLLLSVSWASAAIVVDCDRGQSLNRTLAMIPKLIPATIMVKGTCTEYVQINGFNGLTLQGLAGATLQQPANTPKTGQIYLLSILASQSITISGFTVHVPSLNGIGVGHGSSDVRLRNLDIDGGWGILIYEASQVSIAKVNVNLTSGYAAIGLFDLSDVHIEDCLLQTNNSWHAGLFVGAAHATIHGIVIRDMQQSIVVGSGGIVDLADYDTYYPLGGPSDVVIDNPGNGNFWGAQVTGGSQLNLGTKLRINNAGQPWGWDTAAIQVFDGSVLNAGANLVVSGGLGQGILVSNNSHANLSGSSISGTPHGGLVVLNQSTASVGTSSPLTWISGNAVDLYCDSKSQIMGSANISGAGNVQCTNLLAGTYEAGLP